ncbi:MAG: glycoside hydrolase family 92 protein, partial [Clostridia bacterium]|nr:glycoside hydrolase family 92 protein [Clostridia bacterium]
ALTSPMFDEIELTVAGGKFVIKAEGAGDGLRYIKSAKLNGKEYNKAFISHADLISGGELVLEMSDRPNKAWGLEK